MKLSYPFFNEDENSYWSTVKTRDELEKYNGNTSKHLNELAEGLFKNKSTSTISIDLSNDNSIACDFAFKYITPSIEAIVSHEKGRGETLSEAWMAKDAYTEIFKNFWAINPLKEENITMQALNLGIQVAKVNNATNSKSVREIFKSNSRPSILLKSLLKNSNNLNLNDILNYNPVIEWQSLKTISIPSNLISTYKINTTFGTLVKFIEE